MTTPYEVPLSATPQTFTIQLNGATYAMTVKWNAAASAWVLDIGDASNNPLVQGIPLITGADLLAQYEYLGIGGKIIVQTDNDPAAVPTYDNLGKTGHLFYVSPQ